MIYPDGATYSGAWLYNCRHGQGTQSWPDGSHYTGLWADDSAHGDGKLTTKNGVVHAGEFVRNFFKNEEGKVVHIQGDYEGGHEHGIPHGEGVLKAADGYSYSGAWEKGEK